MHSTAGTSTTPQQEPAQRATAQAARNSSNPALPGPEASAPSAASVDAGGQDAGKSDDVAIVFVEKVNGPERLACDAEIHFRTGLLAGLKLVGFSVWLGAEGDAYVTFPSRAFGTATDRKYFDYIRGIENGQAQSSGLKAAILDAYRSR